MRVCVWGGGGECGCDLFIILFIYYISTIFNVIFYNLAASLV